VNHPRWRGACALSRSSAARRALEASGKRSRQATGNSRPCGRRAGDRAQPRAQAKPSTERARAEHEVWGWWAHPQARRAEDGDRSGASPKPKDEKPAGGGGGHNHGRMGGGDF